ncbi:SMI1/KNR4 family protein [Variovorax dokdonensis]|uniref:SMI1/KNR4 family protein n=1 Tax=Variovorax dokdonensis TaxID=344883 RepID=A0ABT7N6Q5_9BURK|nr:SMI1/KNR4 family protein [Variovorax dokdonensis]MDM0043611.1 SMI1/KNR4 family protein [Variovorax dokdonensis]
MDDAFFSPDELAQLRAHGIVIFAGRIIFDARAPMSAEQLSNIEAACAGPLPASLRALWQLTDGGAMDYDLSVRMNGCEEPVNLAELFGHGVDGLRSLPEWIDWEREHGAAPAERLAAVPFGGFEDTDRLYVVTAPAEQAGHVLAWKAGLPAAWLHAMHEDGIATIATNLEAAFAALHLSEDPLEPTGDYFTGQALLDYLDERHGDHDLDLDLADKVVDYYRRALVDWRTPLAAGRLAQESPLVGQVALRHAVAADDAELVRELAAAGMVFDAPLHGSALATDLALGHGAYSAAAALVEAGAPVSSDALDSVEGAISPELADRLLERGAKPTMRAMALCVAFGAPAAARQIGQAYASSHDDLPTAFESARSDLLGELEVALAESRKEPAPPEPAEALAERIAHLQDFAL